MDEPYVPESLKGNAKYAVYGGVGTLLTFVLVAIIMLVVYGSRKGHASWFILAICLLGFFITICFLLNWLRLGTVEDKIKYIVGVQLVLVLLVSIGSFIDMFTPDKPCPVYTPPQCYNDILNYMPSAGAICSGLPTQQCCVPLQSCYLAASPPYTSPYPLLNATICYTLLNWNFDANVNANANANANTPLPLPIPTVKPELKPKPMSKLAAVAVSEADTYSLAQEAQSGEFSELSSPDPVPSQRRGQGQGQHQSQSQRPKQQRGAQKM